jgi:hypothetical protein
MKKNIRIKYEICQSQPNIYQNLFLFPNILKSLSLKNFLLINNT